MPNFATYGAVKVFLPSTKDLTREEDRFWVKLKKKILVGDMLELVKIDDDSKATLAGLRMLIVGWNNTDDEGNALPIDDDTVKSLSKEDFTFLGNWMQENITNAQQGMPDNQKKSSSSTLNSPATAQPQTPPASPPITPSTL